MPADVPLDWDALKLLEGSEELGLASDMLLKYWEEMGLDLRLRSDTHEYKEIAYNLKRLEAEVSTHDVANSCSCIRIYLGTLYLKT